MVNVNDFDVAIPAGDMLETIFSHQNALMLKYHAIEQKNLGRSLPDPVTFDLDNAECQNRLKEFAWRITEELAEATVCLHPETTDNDVVHYLEEIIDAVHFMVEFDLLCRMTPPRVTVYHPQRDRLEQMFEQHPHFPQKLTHPMSQQVLRYNAWLVVEKLGEAMNCLKNKPWKTTHMKTDIAHFDSLVVEFNHKMFDLLALSGFTAETLTKCYLNKNAVNQFRIRSNY